MLEDFRLKVFMAVAENRSFTKAAAVLRITQPAVSQNIAELEKTVGVKLFDRLKGETVLTTEGRVFMEYANRLLTVCTSADNMFTKLPTSTVRISASEEVYNYFVSPSVESFAKVHPEITFERAIFDATAISFVANGQEAMFPLTNSEPFFVERLPWYLILGVMCGLVSLYFTRGMNRLEQLFKRHVQNTWAKFLVGGVQYDQLHPCASYTA